MGEEGRDAIGGLQVLPFIVCPHNGHTDTEAFYFNEEGRSIFVHLENIYFVSVYYKTGGDAIVQ